MCHSNTRILENICQRGIFQTIIMFIISDGLALGNFLLHAAYFACTTHVLIYVFVSDANKVKVLASIIRTEHSVQPVF